MDARWARPWFLAAAAAALAGIVVQVFVTADSSTAFGATPLARVANMLAYFTILSNILVGITSLQLAIRLDRNSMAFRVARLTGVLAIALTFVVFHVALSRLLDLDSWAQVANQLQHTVVPIMAMVGWLAFGPRGLTSPRIAACTAIFPLAYMIFTLIRGPLASDFYPYPFTNAHKLGYVAVTANAVWIALVFLALAAGANKLDGRLARGQPATPATSQPG